MRRFSGFLALIVLIAVGLGVVYYDKLWPGAARTEVPSAITAGTDEGPGDESPATSPAETATAPDASAAAARQQFPEPGHHGAIHENES